MMDQLLSKQMKQKRHKITSNYEFHNMVQLGVGGEIATASDHIRSLIRKWKIIQISFFHKCLHEQILC